MKLSILAAVMISLATQSMAQTNDDGPCADQHGEHAEDYEMRSPDPAQNVDGYGQLVGERGETNTGAETSDGDAYTGDPAYGDCDGR